MVVMDGVHLVGDNVDELHRFARKVGLKRDWFRGGSRNPHYDILSKSIRERAIVAGVMVMGTRNLLKREAWREQDGIHG